MDTQSMGQVLEAAKAIQDDARDLGLAEAGIPEQRYAVACVGCAITMHLQMIPQRDKYDQIVGWLFCCEECRPSVIGKILLFAFPEEPEND